MSKWFIAPMHMAAEKMKTMFDDRICNYQVISDERVVEHWTCFKDGEAKEVMMSLTRNGSDDHVSIHIYELNPIASKIYRK